MELTTLTLALIDSAWLLNVLTVAVGLGLVIFVHELGHFLVAKWCGVYVERFSIGFGQPILARKWGETEYVIGWLPLGGYVKMLGQDDMDPGQMSDEEVAQDPRSYSAKSVPQRMAIISAGVIMNVITAVMFFAIAYGMGIETTDRVVGSVQVGMPAWKQGIQPGDTLTGINGRPVNEFNDLRRGTMLSRGPVNLSGIHPNGDTYTISIEPDVQGIRRMIGVGPAASLQLIPSLPEDPDFPPTLPGTAASGADFEYEDQILAVNGEPVEDHFELLSLLNQHKSESVELKVSRKSGGEQRTEADITLPAETFVGLDLKMAMGKVVDVQSGSPAAAAGFKVGDKIAKIDGLDVENDLDPFRLTEAFSERAGQTTEVVVGREVPGGSTESVTLKITPNDRMAWSEPPVSPDSPLSIPSIGLAYHLLPTVFSVKQEGIAASHEIHPRDTVTKVDLKKGPNAKEDRLGDETYSLEIGDKGWAHAFWVLQELGCTRIVSLTIQSKESTESRVVDLTPVAVDDWYLPTTRGLFLQPLFVDRRAEDFSEALAMGFHSTKNNIEDIYLTLRGLFTRDISPKGLSGPIGIAKIAFVFAEAGIPKFLEFLGMISVNLAVINFLPIPVLDGGHMVMLLWEGITRKKLPMRIVEWLSVAGLLFLLSLIVFVSYLDLFVSKN